MNFKTTLILLVLLAGAAGGYLLMRSSGPAGPGTPPADPATPLVTGSRFQTIAVERDGQLLELAFESGRWRQTAPVRFPVRRETVEALINAALALTPRQTFAADDGLDNTVVTQPSDETTGLDQPDAVVSFTSDTGTHTLELGRASVAGTAYLRTRADGAVHLVDPTLHQLLPALDSASLWPQTLPTFKAANISAIDLRSDNHVFALRRGPAGWTLGKHEDERADHASAEAVAAVGVDVTALRYLPGQDGDPTKYGLDEPAAALTTANPSGQTQTLTVGAPADLGGQTRYATWSDTDGPSSVVFVIAASRIAPLFAEPDQLRDPRIVTALPESIRGQHVNRVGRDSMEIASAPAAGGTGLRYAFVNPSPGYAPDPELAPRWLTLLTRLEVQGYSRAPREAQAPVAVVELKLAGDRSEFVRLYADRDGRENTLLAVRDNEAVAALVSGEAVAPLLAPVVTLRDRALPVTTPLSEVRLQRDDGHEFVFTTDNNGWTLVEAQGQPWEIVAFSQLREWMESPRVVEWTAMSELPRGPIARLSTGPDKPAYVVNVDQNLGQRTDLPGVFRLPPEIGPLLAYEYRARMLLPVTADQIVVARVWSGTDAAATAASGAAPTAVMQRGDDGTLMDAQSNPLADPEGWAELPNRLAGLAAKRYFEGRPDESPADLVIQLDTRQGQSHTLVHFEAGRWSFDGQPLFIDAELNDALTDPEAPWNATTTNAP